MSFPRLVQSFLLLESLCICSGHAGKKCCKLSAEEQDLGRKRTVQLKHRFSIFILSLISFRHLIPRPPQPFCAYLHYAVVYFSRLVFRTSSGVWVCGTRLNSLVYLMALSPQSNSLCIGPVLTNRWTQRQKTIIINQRMTWMKMRQHNIWLNKVWFNIESSKDWIQG